MFPKINYYISKFVKIFKLILVSFLLMGILHIWYQVLWTYDLMTEGTGYFHMFISILTILIKYNIINNKESFYAGTYQSKDKLNYTLLETVKILNDNKINNWFIAYGTLLGIIRGNSCIEGDDDIDIICNKDDYQRIKDIFTSKKFNISMQHPGRFLQIKGNSKYSQVDFYMCDVDKKGNFKDNWENILWSNCYGESMPEVCGKAKDPAAAAAAER